MLADCGIDVDLEDTTGGETPLYYAIKNQKKEVVQFLIERRANLDHQSSKFLTPYQLAKRESSKEILKMLVDAGCSTVETEIIIDAP